MFLMIPMVSDMPPGTDCPYPIWILAFFEMIQPYRVVYTDLRQITENKLLSRAMCS